jgi:arginyl-tRNA synthetase
MSSSKLPAERFRHEVIKLMSDIMKVSPDKIDAALERPPESTGAELALPCFSFANKHGKNPVDAANNIVKSIKKTHTIARAHAVGPYINFFADWDIMNSMVLERVLQEKDGYGKSKHKKPEKVMVEYSSPNTNKPLHLGHLRNDSLGMALSNILEAVGHNVIKAILYSDRGMGVSKSMLAYDKWGRNRKPGKKKSDHFVGDFYVMFEKKKNDKLEKELVEVLKKWEAGESDTRKLWKKIDSWVINGFKETYKTFGSEFDVEFRESEFYNKAGDLVKKGLDKKLFFNDYDNAIIADLERYKLTKKVVLRSDGTAVYVTNDLALTPHKFDKYKLDRSIWVVGSEQDLYFQQLFKILELLGFKWVKNNKCLHFSYGLVYLPEGKMKSREGTVVDADDIIKDTVSIARKEIKKRDPKLGKKELEQRAWVIGLGALKYFLLKMEAKKNIHFDPKETVSFDGNTGPYIQYSHARACSILRKAKNRPAKFDAKRLTHEKERALIRKLMEFPETVNSAAKYLKPNYIASYAFELATMFNEFYESVPVLKKDNVHKGHEHIRNARLALVKASIITLKNALALLGIEAPERM